MITCAGMIGIGKSSLTKLLSEDLGTKAFFEPVKDNPVLPLFYRGNKLVERGTRKTNPYAFLLQVYFLNMRFKMIKEAMQQDNNVLDRSIYEDAIFMKMNYEQGHTTEEEWNVYCGLLKNMMEELPFAAHKKSPDLMINIKASYDTIIADIVSRGRKFEQLSTDPSLANYYKDLIARYRDWFKDYDASPTVDINRDKYDFVNNVSDRNTVLDIIEAKLVELGKLTPDKFEEIKAKRELQ
ncbi:deoxynucleoside kinase [Lactobacillus amylolyticus]|uniref:deoxynucleoside kinase n=1 Tax=Lactobacillus amylolyticus TaxID=83683 RepID=UPI002490C0B8|nr:deoxynucleoside kinase [Lactobacillus amylolyticus]